MSELEQMTDKELETLKERTTELLRSRERTRLLAEECYCDRYTCGRCQALDRLK